MERETIENLEMRRLPSPIAPRIVRPDLPTDPMQHPTLEASRDVGSTPVLASEQEKLPELFEDDSGEWSCSTSWSLPRQNPQGPPIPNANQFLPLRELVLSTGFPLELDVGETFPYRTLEHDDDALYPDLDCYPPHPPTGDGKPYGFVDPSLIHPEINHPMATSRYCDNFPTPSSYILPPCPSLTESPQSVFDLLPDLRVGEVTPCLATNDYIGLDASLLPVESRKSQLCTCPDCGRAVGDLKTHMLTHQKETPPKCPISTCNYHTNGFMSKRFWNRHILTHFEGFMACAFCAEWGSAAGERFKRTDALKRHIKRRHIKRMHRARPTPPNSLKKSTSGAVGSLDSSNNLTGEAPDPPGICSTCSETFPNAQDYCEHLDDCVLRFVGRIVQRIMEREDPSELITAQKLTDIVAEHVRDTPGKKPVTGDFASRPGKGERGNEGVSYGSKPLPKDDKMLSNNYEAWNNLSGGKPYLQGLDVQTLKADERVPTTTPTEEPHQIKDAARLLQPVTEEVQSEVEVKGLPVRPTAPAVVNHSTERREPNAISDRLSSKTTVATIISHDNQQAASSETLARPKPSKISLENKPEDDIVEVGIQGAHEMASPSLHSAETSSCTTDRSESFASCSSPEDSPSPGRITSSKKEAIIKRILGQFKSWLDSRLTLLAYQLDGGGRSFVFNDYPTAPGQITGQPGQTPGGRKRRRDSDDPDGSDDGKEGEDRKRGREPKRVKTDPEGGPDFACPFLKHNVRKYETKRCCARSSWKTVHRVKEHVYRKHRLPQFKCNRCCSEFQSSTQLADHQRLEVPCEIRLQEPQDGVNEEQVLALRCRKKPKGNISEAEKWTNMYKIIFPDDDLVPSPYHDIQFQLDEQGQPARVDTNLLRDLGDHARRELPRLMRPRLEDMLDRVIEEGLTSDRVVNLAQGVFQQILQTFKVPEVGYENCHTDGFHVPCDSLQGNAYLAASQGVPPLNGGLADLGSCVEGEAKSSLGNGGSMPYVSQGLFDIIQDTMVDSLGTIQYDFDELFQSAAGGLSQPDSGYESLERNSASEHGNEKG